MCPELVEGPRVRFDRLSAHRYTAPRSARPEFPHELDACGGHAGTGSGRDLGWVVHAAARRTHEPVSGSSRRRGRRNDEQTPALTHYLEGAGDDFALAHQASSSSTGHVLITRAGSSPRSSAR